MSHRTWDAYGLGSSSGYLHGYHEDGNYEEDSASGLKLLGYRYYDPTIGRFLNPDPAMVGSNWYAYCGNDPVTSVDSMGLQAIPMGGIKMASLQLGLLVDPGSPWSHSFSSQDAAAIAAMEYIWPRAWAAHSEMGGWINEPHQGQFVLGPLVLSSPGVASMTDIFGQPYFGVAIWHLHPFLQGHRYKDVPYIVGDPDVFSGDATSQGGDIGVSRNVYHKDIYVKGPHVSRRYTYLTAKDVILKYYIFGGK